MAARFAAIARRTAYDRRERDEHFAAAWDAALEAGQRARIRERTRRTNGQPDHLAAQVRAVRYSLDHRVIELEQSRVPPSLERARVLASTLRGLREDLFEVERILDRQARDRWRAWREAHPEAA